MVPNNVHPTFPAREISVLVGSDQNVSIHVEESNVSNTVISFLPNPQLLSSCQPVFFFYRFITRLCTKCVFECYLLPVVGYDSTYIAASRRIRVMSSSLPFKGVARLWHRQRGDNEARKVEYRRRPVAQVE